MPELPPIIGLCGYAGSGKDSLFKCIQKIYPPARRFAFADKLKCEVAEMMGVSVDSINSHKYMFRATLQQHGAMRRNQDPNYWIQEVDELIGMWKPTLAVITDVRHLNEADWIKRSGGLVVKVVRHGVGPANDHTSETEVDSINHNYSLLNPKSVDGLMDSAMELLCYLNRTGSFLPWGDYAPRLES